MTKKLIVIIILILVGGGFLLNYFLSQETENDVLLTEDVLPENNVLPEETQCEFNEMVFYYRDDCSWCQKVKDEDTISKIDALGVNVKSVNTKIGPVEHQFKGVPTFVIDNKVYSGYKTFNELKELLVCSDKEPTPKDDFLGEKGEAVSLINQELSIPASRLEDGLAHFYNTQLGGKSIYFFVIKDNQGAYRAAANACKVCFDSRMGFRQQGDDMVCNTCGNKYPLEKIATEKGGCNPGPINPNLELRNGEIIIQQSDIEQVSELF